MTRNIAIFSIMLIITLSPLNAQTFGELQDSLYTVRAPLPPSAKDGSFFSLNDELGYLIDDIADGLNLFDILVCIYIDTSEINISGPINQKDIYFLKELTRFREAIVITESYIIQDTIQINSEDQEGLVGSIIKSDRLVATELGLVAHFIDIEKMQVLGSLEEKAYFEHKNPVKSKNKALARLEEKIHQELKRIYWFSSEFNVNEQNNLVAVLGRKQGVHKGQTFEIVEPDRIWEDDEGEFIEDGGVVGLASVIETSRDSCQLKIIREWQPFYPESWIVEQPNPIYALQFMLVPPTTSGFFTVGAGVHARPMNNLDWGLGLHFTSMDDSFNDKVYGLGFDSFGMWRFRNTSQIDVGFIVGINLDIPFRKDHDNNVVSTMLLSSYLGISGEFPLFSRMDFLAISGYRFGTESDTWEYSVDEESIPAYWEKDPPSVNNNGFMMSLGFKFYLF